MNQPLHWGILGLGTIAREFAGWMQQTGRPFSVASRSEEKAKAFAAEFAAKQAYGSYEELLADPAVQAVYVATPHSNHYEYMLQCLRAGKHVLCEKAITVNARQLEEVCGLAKQKGLVVGEAMTIFHMPLYRRLGEFLRSGTLGRVQMVDVTFGCLMPYDASNRYFNPELAGGALLDIGTYSLSFARCFMPFDGGEVLTAVQPAMTGVDEQSGILIKNKGGQIASVTLAMRGMMPARGVVACEGGFVEVTGFPRAATAQVTYADGRIQTIEAGDTSLAMRYEVEDFEQAVAGGGDSTLVLTRDVVAVMTEARERWGIVYPFEQ